MTHFSWLPHINKRKRYHRIHKKLKPYPHPNPWIRYLDYLVLVVGVLGPMSNIPQIMKIYLEQNVAGLSFVTWSLFCVFTVPWLVYGIVHKSKPIIIANSLWFTTQFTIVMGILIYSV
jgi:uncharacterized protein with PQ loop repeat